MHILFPSKKDGGPIKRGARPNPNLAKVLIQPFLILASSISGVLYYLLASGIDSGSKSILHFIALSGGMPRGSKSSLNPLQIFSYCEWLAPGTLVLFTSLNAANTPLVSNSEGATSQTMQDSHISPLQALISYLTGHISNTVHEESKYSMLLVTYRHV